MTIHPEYITGIETLITPEKAAVIFDVKPKTIGDWARAGILPHYKPGGNLLRFRISELIIAIEKMKNRTPEQKEAAHQRALEITNK